MQLVSLSALTLLAGLGSALPESHLQARGPPASSPSFQARCEAFGSKINGHNKHDFQNDVTLHSVTYIPPGGNISMATTPDFQSQIYMEAWLPGNYTGRFLSTGNGGLGGCVQYADMLYAAQFGFATVGTNNGHFGDSGRFFLGNPEVLEDFAYRAMHTGVEIGKKLTKLFYTQTKNGYNKSYYLGCSTGGRQGWKSLEKFPDDFDGVVAGAPAFNFINLASWGARVITITGNATSDTFITAAQWGGLIHNEIMRQCDGLDGATDGIIEDPDLCHPNLETLLCSSSSTDPSSCLTRAQVNTASQMFTPLVSQKGEWMYPRMQPGSEPVAAYVYYSGQPVQYPWDWYRYVVFNNSAWDAATWTVADAEMAARQNPFDISTWDSQLVSGFQKKGGKVLHYHGLEDPIITSDSSKAWYKYLVDSTNTSPSELDSFYRFFPISGMSHCSPGAGASYIGQGLGTYVPGSEHHPEDNVLMAMVQWVEEGIAPEFVRGTKLARDGSVEYTRKHCKFPKRNVYVGPVRYAVFEGI
uniref:Carboxylic ester hydrolase n=1 Tax=Talaromyces marneffei PM1 TaxID=1077442 RepID=A0A093V979_TALMA